MNIRSSGYKLAPEKTKVMSVSSPFGRYVFYLDGLPLEEVRSYCYLGGTLSRSGSDFPHFKSLLVRFKGAIRSLAS